MQARATLVLIGASILWGMTWLPLKSLHQLGFDGVPLTFWLYLFLFLLVLPWVFKFRTVLTSHWKVLLGVAMLGGGAQLAFNTALIYGDVIRVMVLFYLVPLWGVLGGKLFLHERIDGARWLGVVFSLFGAFLVVGGLYAFQSPPSWLDGLAVLSGFLFAMNNIVFRLTPTVPVSLKISFMFLGSILLAGTVILSMDMTFVTSELTTQAWLWLFAYAAIWMIAANFGTQWAVTHMEAGRASIIIILELVVAVLSASLILGESMSSLEMFGGTLILLAAYIEAKRVEAKRAPEHT